MVFKTHFTAQLVETESISNCEVAEAEFHQTRNGVIGSHLDSLMDKILIGTKYLEIKNTALINCICFSTINGCLIFLLDTTEMLETENKSNGNEDLNSRLR